MGQQVYQELFEVMKNRRGPYTGVEVPDFPAPPKDPKELITSLKASFANKT